MSAYRQHPTNPARVVRLTPFEQGRRDYKQHGEYFPPSSWREELEYAAGWTLAVAECD